MSAEFRCRASGDTSSEKTRKIACECLAAYYPGCGPVERQEVTVPGDSYRKKLECVLHWRSYGVLATRTNTNGVVSSSNATRGARQTGIASKEDVQRILETRLPVCTRVSL